MRMSDAAASTSSGAEVVQRADLVVRAPLAPVASGASLSRSPRAGTVSVMASPGVHQMSGMTHLTLVTDGGKVNLGRTAGAAAPNVDGWSATRGMLGRTARAGGGGVTSVRARLIPRTLHTSDRPSATAQWTTLFRALELVRPADERIVTDRFAPAFLTGAFSRALDPLNRAAPAAADGGAAGGGRHRHVGAVPAPLHRRPPAAGRCRRSRRSSCSAPATTAAPTASPAPWGPGRCSRWTWRRCPGARRRWSSRVPDLFDRARIRRVEIDFRTESLEDRLLAHGFVARRAAPSWRGRAWPCTSAG